MGAKISSDATECGTFGLERSVFGVQGGGSAIGQAVADGGGITLSAKGLVRLLTVGGILFGLMLNGPWFWAGIGLGIFMIVGVAGATGRPSAAWWGGFALLMATLVHLGLVQPLVGSALAGIGTIGFVLVWSSAGAPGRRAVTEPSPVLRRRIG
jgi:hypothetical protein